MPAYPSVFSPVRLQVRTPSKEVTALAELVPSSARKAVEAAGASTVTSTPDVKKPAKKKLALTGEGAEGHLAAKKHEATSSTDPDA